jgi:hypothetical protein
MNSVHGVGEISRRIADEKRIVDEAIAAGKFRESSRKSYEQFLATEPERGRKVIASLESAPVSEVRQEMKPPEKTWDYVGNMNTPERAPAPPPEPLGDGLPVGWFARRRGERPAVTS